MHNGLEPTQDEWDSWTRQVVEFARLLPKQTQKLPAPVIAEEPLSGGLPRILEHLAQGVSASVSTTLPGQMAYIPGGALYSAALANFIGNVTNCYTGLEDQAPVLVEFEKQVIRWLCKEFGLPTKAFGTLTTGGSGANMTAIIAGRVHVLGETGDFSKARLYVSDQVHHSVQKAAFCAGIPRANCVSIITDNNFKLSIPALREQLESDLKAGYKPFMIVGSAGTTNTGAIDPLEELAAISRQQGLWFHIDGAYGGAFMLCPAGKKRLVGIEQADSITIDPHKGMFLPYGTGCLLVKDPSTLLRVYDCEADYLNVHQRESPASLGLELTREYRGIRLWLPLLLHGAAQFRQALSEKLELTQWLHEELQKLPVQILNKPELSVIVFRPGDISEKVTALGRTYLVSTKLRGEKASRVCILSFRTHFEQVQTCLEDIKQTLYKL